MKHILEVDSVELHFGERSILSDVYLKCETGKIAGLLGRNGSGKTCLMNIIYGSLDGNNQSVRVDNIYMKHLYKNAGLVTYLPQFSITPKRFALKTILKDFQLSFESLTQCFPEFSGRENDKAGYLSGGLLRLLEVFIAINATSKFIILDEPFSHIMPLHIEQLQKIISEQKSAKGIIISDHLYKPVLDIADTLYIINDGKVHQTKTPEDLIRFGYLLRI